MVHKDLRDWLEAADRLGELRRFSGVHWDLEIGAASDLTNDCVLFDDIPGYPKGFRVASNLHGGKRIMLTMNMPGEYQGVGELTRAWRDRLKTFQPIPPKVVPSGPIMENVDSGNKVDVLKFPVPKWHPLDAGRYIGTADCVITREPDEGWVNFGTYRVIVHDAKTLGVYISRGKQGLHIIQKYHQRGQPCPVVVLAGEDATLFLCSYLHVAYGVSEYDFAGWLKGEPIEVIKGEATGLPIPARAEIAIEGEIRPGDTKMEGPFGEWTGYSEPREMPVIRVKRVYYRNNPIHTGALIIARPPKEEATLRSDFMRSGMIWHEIEQAGARGVVGVASYGRPLIVVALKNYYAGQSTQAGLLAMQCHSGAYMGRYVIVVDDDIDPYNLDAVMWAVARNADPRRSIQIVDRSWGSLLDSAVRHEGQAWPEGAQAPVYNSRCLIDACRPIEWDPKLKQYVDTLPEMRKALLEKHKEAFAGREKKEAITWVGGRAM